MKTGERQRNTEFITVRDGRLAETHRQGVHGVVVVAALPGPAGRRGQQPGLPAGADRGRAVARKGGQLADGQQRGTARPGIGVDIKPALTPAMVRSPRSGRTTADRGATGNRHQ